MTIPSSSPDRQPTSARDVERAIAQAMVLTWRDLRSSARAGRAMSLPNVLRLFRRRVASMPADARIEHLRARGRDRLARRYRKHQPF